MESHDCPTLIYPRTFPELPPVLLRRDERMGTYSHSCTCPRVSTVRVRVHRVPLGKQG
jgi:hypothetical protein